MQLARVVVCLQGLFAIVEFENEESAQKVLTHNEDILLRGCRLVVKPRLLRQQVAAPGDNDDSNVADQSDADPHSQLVEKLASCGSVCIYNTIQYNIKTCNVPYVSGILFVGISSFHLLLGM